MNLCYEVLEQEAGVKLSLPFRKRFFPEERMTSFFVLEDEDAVKSNESEIGSWCFSFNHLIFFLGSFHSLTLNVLEAPYFQ